MKKAFQQPGCTVFSTHIVMAAFPTLDEIELTRQFRQMAATWKKETAFISMLPKKVLHPAYQRIIGMGRPAVPLILRELQQTRGHWLWALHAITGEDPAKPGASFDQAIDAWIAWGKQQGLL